MRKNMGDTDGKIQGGMGMFIVSMLFWGPRTMWALLGVPVMVAAMTGKNAVYSMVGISTRPRSRWERIRSKLW